jgi:hypothetical protein
MAEDLMRYDQLAREALRGVVREALRRAADDGLPGGHHFYITFRSHAPGVDLDADLEHQFWDLAVDDDAFEVTLKFKGIPKYLRVPFDAVIQFHDPSVGFTLRFDAPVLTPSSEPATFPAPQPRSPNAASAKPAAKPPAASPARPGEAPPAAAPGGQVVSLEAFRKKPD